MVSSRRRQQRAMAIGCAALVAGLDQLTKAVAGLPVASAVAHPIRNSGFSLQLVRMSRWTETLAMAVVLVLIAVLCLRAVRRGWLSGWIAGLVVGGCLGNLLDRTAFGSVRDFLPVGPLALNVADLAVVVGITAAAVAHHRFAREGR